jgi:hypothetical protein
MLGSSSFILLWEAYTGVSRCVMVVIFLFMVHLRAFYCLFQRGLISPGVHHHASSTSFMLYCTWQKSLQFTSFTDILRQKESKLYELYHSVYLPRGIKSRNNLELPCAKSMELLHLMTVLFALITNGDIRTLISRPRR